MDMRLGTMASVALDMRSSSLEAAGRDLEYKVDLVRTRDFRLDKGGTVPGDD
jgi:hypothetical protein